MNEQLRQQNFGYKPNLISTIVDLCVVPIGGYGL